MINVFDASQGPYSFNKKTFTIIHFTTRRFLFLESVVVVVIK